MIAVALPVLGGAQPPTERGSPGTSTGATSRPAEVDLSLHGGQTTYVLCNQRHRVRFGGLGVEVRHRIGEHGVPLRLAAGGSVVDDRHVDADGETVPDSQPATMPSMGLTAQSGWDWRYFGFRLGLSGWVLNDLDEVYVGGFFAATLRLGPEDGLSLRAGVADEAAIHRGLAWAELRWTEPGRIAIGGGVRLLMGADYGAGYVDVVLGLGQGHRLGIRGQLQLVTDGLHPQAVLTYGFDVQGS
ncbi:MAG: hypothetical protein NZ898_08025 [Myxococcota bacterium]|nr:hypothetical protein [Myxococcota bacterium]MDW8363172.1 hypothetical protein [Myxococcales bacterium]